MKKTTFTFLLSFACCRLAAQCPTSDVTLTTQGQIDSFQIYYPGCTDMPGSITISGSDITRLDSLYPLKKIGGPLRIENTHLANLNGLNQLDAVQSEFTIRYNPNLTTLSGLENLRFVGKRFFSTGFSHAEYGFVIAYNPGLKTLSGLDNFMSTTGCLSLIANDSLVSLEGLGQLTFIAGCYGGDDAGNDWAKGLEVYENPLLVSLNGLGQMDTFVALSIEANPLFSSLHDLSNLRVVEHNLSLSGNPSLKSLGGRTASAMWAAVCTSAATTRCPISADWKNLIRWAASWL